MLFAAGPGPDQFLSISRGFRRGQQDFPGRGQGNVCILPQTQTFAPSLSPEPVSDPSIQILGWALANGSCSVTLNCTAERGDNVSYSWGRQDTNTSGLCSRNGSLLHLSYTLQNTSITCACTASNPISSRVVTFNSSECSYEQGGKSPVADSALSSLLVLLLLCRGLFHAVLGSLKGAFCKKSGHCVTCSGLPSSSRKRWHGATGPTSPRPARPQHSLRPGAQGSF